MSKLNRLANAHNEYQGSTKKVLCVCSAGLLRSPTAAVVLSQEPFNYNTRACGATLEYALVPLDDVLLHWADEIVCMEQEHADKIKTDKPVIVLDIEDNYPYRHPDLMSLIKERYTAKAWMDATLEEEDGSGDNDTDGSEVCQSGE